MQISRNVYLDIVNGLEISLKFFIKYDIYKPATLKTKETESTLKIKNQQAY
jgi:hypothetical protein